MASKGADSAPLPAKNEGDWRQRIKAEAALALEITALAGLIFSRPILDVFGRSPETFVMRKATTTEIVLFGLVVAIVPVVVLVLVGAVSRLFGSTARHWVHLVLVGLLAGVAANRIGQDVTGWPYDATKLLLAGVLAAVIIGVVRWKLPVTATFLRYTGVASVLFLVQFLFASPTSDVAFGSPPGVDAEVDAEVAAALGDDPPPIVFLVLDAFPTASLLDGRGQIDEELFPNLASLAGTSTWYRNDTSVAAWTKQAVPALLTGRYPVSGMDEDENLFTLLGGSYDIRSRELLTQLCPPELCPRGQSAGLGRLLGDAVDWWGSTDPEEKNDEFALPSISDDRFGEGRQWIEDLDASTGGRPDLTFLHIMLPHGPWQYLSDGTPYVLPPSNVSTGMDGGDWTSSGVAVGYQRQLLQAQAADVLVGELLDKFREAGTFDDTLFVVTADHGESFVPNVSVRALEPDNVPYVMWTPLLIKAPGQTSGEVNDDNVQAIDIVPTIAEMLGIDMPWEVDGLPVSEVATERDPDVKFFTGHHWHKIHDEDDDRLIEVDAEEAFEEVLAHDPVKATGPDAVWRRTDHGDLLGRDLGALRVGEPTGIRLETILLNPLREVDLAKPLWLERVGKADLPVGTVVAYVLNDTVAAVTEVENPIHAGEPNLVHALLHPDSFVAGPNQLEAYVVEGPPGQEELHALDVANG